jgi:hypothetical protein
MTLDFETTMQLAMFVVAFGVFYLALTSDSL